MYTSRHADEVQFFLLRSGPLQSVTLRFSPVTQHPGLNHSSPTDSSSTQKQQAKHAHSAAYQALTNCAGAIDGCHTGIKVKKKTHLMRKHDFHSGLLHRCGGGGYTFLHTPTKPPSQSLCLILGAVAIHHVWKSCPHLLCGSEAMDDEERLMMRLLYWSRRRRRRRVCFHQ